MKGADGLGFFIGDEATEKPSYEKKWPTRHGIAKDWEVYGSSDL